MTFLQLYLLLRKNKKLSERRSPLWEQNQVALIFTLIGVGFMAIYFIAIGTILGWASIGGDYALIFCGMPFIMLLDFLMRFGMQQTPSMMVKPYLLQPVRKRQIIDCFLVQTLLDGNNYIWMFMFLPYTFITWCGGASTPVAFLVLVLIQFLISINSQWYLLMRTLINRNMLWWLLPVSVYGLAYGLPILIMGAERGFEAVIDTCVDYGMSPYAIIIYVVLFVLLFLTNRMLQIKCVDEETAQADEVGKRAMSRFTFFERFGEIGEYLKLEIKCAMRCKTIKQRFISGIVVITMLSLIIAYTDTYTGRFAVNTWCLYCFLFFGATTLIKIMGVEGNYIDFLMVHRENLYTLLRAKYYFYCAVLLLPLLLLLPAIITGKFPLLMILAYMFVTTGPCYCLLFHLAIVNKQSLPLNEKVTGKNNFENKLQLFIELIVFFVPVLLSLLLTTLFGMTTGYAIMIITGIIFTATHTYWLKTIYKRMMMNKYKNLDGFHT